MIGRGWYTDWNDILIGMIYWLEWSNTDWKRVTYWLEKGDILIGMTYWLEWSNIDWNESLTWDVLASTVTVRQFAHLGVTLGSLGVGRGVRVHGSGPVMVVKGGGRGSKGRGNIIIVFIYLFIFWSSSLQMCNEL